MKVVIDTSSLLSLVRYYLPFDNNSVLFDFIKVKIEEGVIIIIDKVLNECTYISKGIVIEKLPYLKDKSFHKAAKLPHKTDNLIAPSPGKFLRQVDNQFVNSVMRRKLDDVEYENQKNSFLEDTDMKLIILCLHLLQDNENKDIILVTEESESSNDNKLFKKIPAICKELDIPTMTLPELLKKYEGIDVEFK